MRIIHCADLHLDSKMNRYFSREKARERNSELVNNFQRLVWFAKKNKVKAILIAGDLFDTDKVLQTTKTIILTNILENPQIDFYYLKGNHDKNEDFVNEQEAPSNLKLFDTQWRSYTANQAGDIVITGLEFDGKNSSNIYESLSLKPQAFNIVMLHGQDVQYKSDDDGELISLPQLRNKGIDYLALGHIHAYKEGQLDYRGSYCYPGCLEGRGFDECGEHGFVLLDIDENNFSYTKKFVPFAKRRLYVLNVELSGCTHHATIMSKIDRQLSEGDYSVSDLLQLVLTGTIPVECQMSLLFLADYYKKYYLVAVKDETTAYVESQDVSLSAEFARVVLQDDTLSNEEKSMIIYYGNKALAGELE